MVENRRFLSCHGIRETFKHFIFRDLIRQVPHVTVQAQFTVEATDGLPLLANAVPNDGLGFKHSPAQFRRHGMSFAFCLEPAAAGLSGPATGDRPVRDRAP